VGGHKTISGSSYPTPLPPLKPPYVVTGTIIPDATGNYFLAGTYNTKPYYKHESQVMYLFSHVIPGNYWAIGPTLSLDTYWEREGQGILGEYIPVSEYSEGVATVIAGV